MSLATALALGSFADLVEASEAELYLERNTQSALTGGGERLRKGRAPAMWRAKVTTPPMERADALALMAIINSLEETDPFLLYDYRMPFPSTDPDGATFGSATPIVGAITDQRNIAFTGFPNNYEIPAGTYFQIIFDTSRYYLGQFAVAKTASGTGAVSATKITPPIPNAVDGGNAVTLIKPSAKFLVVEDSAHISLSDDFMATLSFEAEQTYSK